PGGGVAPNGFAALAQYDENGDAVIDGNDPIWPALVLWTDLNHDGVSQPSELVPIGKTRVTAISVDYHWTGRRDQHGNTFRYQSKVWMETPRPVYDIFFVAAP